MNSLNSISIEPMSAGDIIDRAVRVYRRNALPLLRIVIVPSLIAFAGVVIFSIGRRNFSTDRGDGRVALTTAMIVIGTVLYLFGKAMFYATLGGSARALIAHFFDGKPILAREVFSAVRERKWGLTGVMLIMLLIAIAVFMMLLFVEGIIFAIIGALAAAVMVHTPGWFQYIFWIVSVLFSGGVALLCFLLVYSRIVYVPQVMMVENKGVFSSISRSFALASGETKRIAAVTLFWFYVAWSLLWLLTIPIGFYAWWSFGVDVNPFNPDVPLWYAIAQQTATQVSEILIAPIAMLGFTLLYLNSRVRQEGYDVEVLANRLLPQPPAIQMPHPAFDSIPARQSEDFAVPSSIISLGLSLGLNDDRASVKTGNFPSVAERVNGEFAAVQTQPIASDNNGERAVTEFPPEELVEPSIASETAGRIEVAGQNITSGGTKSQYKSCRWCDSQAAVDDRFCRVCGSVF